jgi:hypothetical protein
MAPKRRVEVSVARIYGLFTFMASVWILTVLFFVWREAPYHTQLRYWRITTATLQHEVDSLKALPRPTVVGSEAFNVTCYITGGGP